MLALWQGRPPHFVILSGRMVELEDGLNRNVHLAQDDYGIIVTWMEVADNFAAIHGSSDKTKISGKPKVKKIDAFKALT
ncbi:hypothetical protein F442_13751 [Phytophthora nicotianae P10297]|uniref:Uncharacterized protein n=3 Tax=Phytophthora nicotianae TaxID=4792 RepID=W2YVH8_PHYNI|nr:hypothetical protein F442_13751 [Phytophthora nicotianae P10297]